ncbi:uncharacterized PE-PGRS family protein PE_PGRS10-like isoform X2 [Paramacrobiotus metropolitanus]|nr:uncharacterized PE-PGRS family protein PE_PGRS10-like isoform X2 [Paramacrobiotus metropolitanus]
MGDKSYMACCLLIVVMPYICVATVAPAAEQLSAEVFPSGSTTRIPMIVDLSVPNTQNGDPSKTNLTTNITGLHSNPASQVDIIFNAGGPSSAGFSMEAMRETMERNFENMFLMNQLRGMGGMGGGAGMGSMGGMGGMGGGGGMGMSGMGFGGLGAMAGMLPFMNLMEGRQTNGATTGEGSGSPRSAAFHAGFGSPNMNPFGMGSMMGMGIPPSMMMRSMIGAAGSGMPGMPLGLNALAAAAAMPPPGAEPVVTGAG